MNQFISLFAILLPVACFNIFNGAGSQNDHPGSKPKIEIVFNHDLNMLIW
jgi:hypothetical protein